MKSESGFCDDHVAPDLFISWFLFFFFWLIDEFPVYGRANSFPTVNIVDVNVGRALRERSRQECLRSSTDSSASGLMAADGTWWVGPVRRGARAWWKVHSSQSN